MGFRVHTCGKEGVEATPMSSRRGEGVDVEEVGEVVVLVVVVAHLDVPIFGVEGELGVVVLVVVAPAPGGRDSRVVELGDGNGSVSSLGFR